MYIPTNGKFNLDEKGVEKIPTPSNGGRPSQEYYITLDMAKNSVG